MDKNQVAAVRKEAEFLCLMAAQVLAEEYADPRVARIFAIGATMRMIKRREMVVMITGPNFTPHLFPVDERLKAFMEAME